MTLIYLEPFRGSPLLQDGGQMPLSSPPDPSWYKPCLTFPNSWPIIPLHPRDRYLDVVGSFPNSYSYLHPLLVVLKCPTFLSGWPNSSWTSLSTGNWLGHHLYTLAFTQCPGYRWCHNKYHCLPSMSQMSWNSHDGGLNIYRMKIDS